MKGGTQKQATAQRQALHLRFSDAVLCGHCATPLAVTPLKRGMASSGGFMAQSDLGKVGGGVSAPFSRALYARVNAKDL